MRPTLLPLLLLACDPAPRPRPDDTSDADADADADTDTDTDADGDADCVDYAATVAACWDLVVEVGGGGSLYEGLDPEAPTFANDLHARIDDHDPVSYDGLWEAFEESDRRPDGTVWDPYSDVPGGEPPYTFDFTDDRCGNYGAEGDCYNREHSWPASWFGDVSPMKTDLHQVFPTDGYVNGIRGDDPYGPVESPSYTSLNGSLRGTTALCDRTGRVFEPIDAYKGDLARAQLYMGVRYRGEDGGWPGSEATDGSELSDWYALTLVAWHLLDPVDAKERARNDAVEDLQGNRNPFVDRPEFACALWGD